MTADEIKQQESSALITESVTLQSDIPIDEGTPDERKTIEIPQVVETDTPQKDDEKEPGKMGQTSSAFKSGTDLALPPPTWWSHAWSSDAKKVRDSSAKDSATVDTENIRRKKVKVSEPMPKEVKSFLKRRLGKLGHTRRSCPDVRKNTKPKPAVQSAR